MMKVFIDAGHGGSDPGAVNGNLIEKNMTLVTANAAAEFLKQHGCEVKLSRTSDTYLSLSQRATLANQWGANIFVSCHYNAGGGDRGEVIHSVYVGKGKEIAGFVSAEMKNIGQTTVKEYSRTSSSGKGDYHTVIANTNMPAVIVEGCFIDNELDRQIADTVEEQKEIGYAVARGILRYLGIKFEVPQTPAIASSGNYYKFNWIPDMHVIEMDALKFGISVQSKLKNDIDIENFFNLDFSGDANTSAANMADWGNILSNSITVPSWINTSKHRLTTIFVQLNGTVGITKTDDITKIANLKTAISGIPIYPKVSLDAIKAEGYFGSELYNTWHGFLGIRSGKLVYVAAKCGFETMASIFEGLGCSAGIKLDGGGSFILRVNGKTVIATGENRRIHAIGMFE